MATEIVVPSVGESVTEVVIGAWRVKEGDAVQLDETLVELESEKATMEVPASVAGAVARIVKHEGETAVIGEVIAIIDESAKQSAKAPRAAAPDVKPQAVEPAAKGEPPAPADSDRSNGAAATLKTSTARKVVAQPKAMPGAERIAAAYGVDPAEVEGTGLGGRVLKEDVQRHVASSGKSAPQAAPSAGVARDSGAAEEVVPMTPIRRKIAQRLVESQQERATLTTFNECDMTEVMALRESYQDQFVKQHGVKLGFMSFFVKAAVEALRMFPQVNAEVRGTDIVYKNYFDIGIAIGGGKGLVVPVLRNADRLSFSEIELAIADFGERAQSNKLTPDEFIGGTYTVSNGGVYGSLMSTPIINPPQSAVLGLHAIQERPVAREGQVVIRPMMYIAMSYDHRLIDGRESVTFLKRIKDCIEQPSRMLLEI